MSSLSRLITRLIAAILLVQVVLAPAHCLAMVPANAGFETVICSADGTRTIHVGPDGHEAPAHEASRGFCAACHGLPQVALPDPPLHPTPAWMASSAAWHGGAADALLPPARAPPYRPTGPPALS